jgi:hypothetical protein
MIAPGEVPEWAGVFLIRSNAGGPAYRNLHRDDAETVIWLTGYWLRGSVKGSG